MLEIGKSEVITIHQIRLDTLMQVVGVDYLCLVILELPTPTISKVDCDNERQKACIHLFKLDIPLHYFYGFFIEGLTERG